MLLWVFLCTHKVQKADLASSSTMPLKCCVIQAGGLTSLGFTESTEL